ncbi:FAD-binding oxidoreductase [Streptomyces omiyaensis]|uniref:FAD-binding oxidoreductase n=1 Tax=Streptomyces omiyaensis TaxID=68247 RepID=A0ABW7C404_9ACTN|nr:FAD-binding oxidoreductase [Streptomyces omiyaensis]GGY82296.1 oxidoreductase [Streptomyces omiyaensis]
MHGWRRARLTERTRQTATGRTLRLDVPEWPGHLPGQHVDIRLTADDGYQAVRSYSLAAPAGAGAGSIELGVQATSGGEVSPYLADDLPLGAEVEARGPLGGWFVWTPRESGPLLLVAGGSGIVPLMAMVRARLASASDEPCTLLYSVRSPAEVWYAEELDAAAHRIRVRLLHTRVAPDGSARPAGRIGGPDLRDLPPSAEGRCYVCGPTGFVEHVGELLLTTGYAPGRIRTERFG